MRLLKNRYFWLPLTLGLVGLLLLLRVFVSGSLILVPEDIDAVLLVLFLCVAIVVAIHTLVRLSMSYLRELSVQRVRRETLTEHGRFLRRLDHELKNPLTTLRAGLSTLSLTNLDERQQHLIQTMQTETLRLSRLVSDLRKLSDLEAQPLNLQLIHIESFIHDLMLIERERFENEERQLASQVEAGRSEWIVDEDLLTLAVHNLLDNAFKYTQPGDTVQLNVQAQTELVIRVTDNGRGIPSEALPHIWEELYRAEQMQEKVSGSGIGLTLVKAIVERHGGKVSVNSEPGVETAVSLTLPFISPP
ncbi:MAG: HAMP domain-containing histidine kinase [Anaerolineaceae bacterium]|nr:HAMP domain-containing histidine kinase [Anaerolineaceae bacterium]